MFRNDNEKIDLYYILPLFIIITLVFAFFSHLFFKNEYSIINHTLCIRAGFIKYKPIQIKEIKEVSKTRSIVASPAASFDRIKIKYGKFNNYLILSPKNPTKFVNDLQKINSNIKNNLPN